MNLPPLPNPLLPFMGGEGTVLILLLATTATFLVLLLTTTKLKCLAP